MPSNQKIVLLILDGWGLSPSWGGNALVMNKPKNIDALWRDYPHKVLQALGAIGSSNVVGESRLGHSLIGTGRLVQSPNMQINQAIHDRTFFKNPVLTGAFKWAKEKKSNVHLISLLSSGGVHSNIDHLLALLELADRLNLAEKVEVYLDIITDGIDSAPTESLRFIEKIKRKMKETQIGQFSSVAGREFAMDRDENWDKIKQYYSLLTEDDGQVSDSIEKVISAGYREGLTDFNFASAITLANGDSISLR